MLQEQGSNLLLGPSHRSDLLTPADSAPSLLWSKRTPPCPRPASPGLCAVPGAGCPVLGAGCRVLSGAGQEVARGRRQEQPTEEKLQQQLPPGLPGPPAQGPGWKLVLLKCSPRTC